MVDVRQLVADVHSQDTAVQQGAYEALIAATDEPVDWAYEIWDELVHDLTHANNRVRSIAAQVLCNLAKSDPDDRMLATLPRLIEVTRDERFVTARHCLQSLWKIGVAGSPQRQAYRDAMMQRFDECVSEKNATLIRTDIIESMRKVHAATDDAEIEAAAEQLIAGEPDDKQRAKQARAWRRSTT